MRVQPARTGRFTGSVSQYHAPAGILSAPGKADHTERMRLTPDGSGLTSGARRSRPLMLSGGGEFAGLVVVDAHLLDESDHELVAQRAAQSGRQVDRGEEYVQLKDGPLEGVGLHGPLQDVQRR